MTLHFQYEMMPVGCWARDDSRENYGPCREHGDERRPHLVALTDKARLFVQRDAENCQRANGTGSGLCPGWVRSIFGPGDGRGRASNTSDCTGWVARNVDATGTQYWVRAYRFAEFDNDAKMVEFLERLNKDVEAGMDPDGYMPKSGYTREFERVFDQEKAKEVRAAKAKHPYAETSWGPHDATFNGMVQLLVAPEELRDRMRKEGPLMLIKENALKPEQCWHHVTLAYKPTCGEVERLMEWFNNKDYTMTFHPKEVRANPGICAVFGTVTRRGKPLSCRNSILSFRRDDLDVRTVPFPFHTTRSNKGNGTDGWHITIGADEGVQPKESNKLLDDYTTCTAWERYPDLPQAFGLYLNVHGFD